MNQGHWERAIKPNTALEATGHSVGLVAGVAQWGVARASAWALGAKGTEEKSCLDLAYRKW